MMNVVIRNASSHLHTNKYLEKHCSVQATVNIKKASQTTLFTVSVYLLQDCITLS